MLRGSLVHRVEPVYPPMARTARVQGSVVLGAIVDKEGTIKNLRLISGHPLLVPAAVEAVSQWRYRPYVLNGEAIEVETQITVNFILGN
jgi:protein TonB